ncbi:hypothetical protein ACJMK2_004535, partial [Sinanodonta woodiana]
EEEEKVMKWSLTIYYNISIVDDNIPRLRSLDIVPIFSRFLDANSEIYRLTALSALANIIDEKESTEVLQGKTDVIAFLLKKLGLALEDSHHKHLGWSAQECTRTVGRLARNDANKTILVELDCLPHLVKLAKIENMEEQREAVRAIHILTFNQICQAKIVNDKRFKIVDLLEEIKKKNSKDKEITKAIDVDKEITKAIEEITKAHSEDSSGRPVTDGKLIIMISYEQSDQEMLIKIRDLLTNNYVVCINDDNTIEVMAKSVEKAHVFLMCMSRKYKDNPFCQAAAEYASTLKKKIIPLKMENGYTPDGWLGFVCGAKLFFDFASEKYTFESKMKELKREIANASKDEDK